MGELGALVSVYVTTFNRASMLSRALDSVVSQTYRPIEVIVVNDCSADNTEVLVLDYIDQHQSEELRFKYIRLPENRGACHARNRAIEEASGVFITGLDDDDEFRPDRISELLLSWEERYVALCTVIAVDNDQGNISYLSKGVGEISLDKLLDKNLVGSQIFTRTEWMRQAGGFDVAFPAWQDYETWVRILLTFQPKPILKIGTDSYVQHTGHDGPRITSKTKDLQAIHLLRKKYKTLFTPRQQRLLLHKELKARDTTYASLKPWLPAMTWRSAPSIIKRWFICKVRGRK